MEESLFVAGFVITREDWDSFGSDGRAQILGALHRRDLRQGRAPTEILLPAPPPKVEPLPLPPPR